MKASELRIGNRIMDCTNKNRECMVMRLNNGSQYPITYGYDRSVENSPFMGEGLSGIQLTEDWLLKFGFKKNEENDFGDIVYYDLSNSKRRYSVCNNHDEWQFMLTTNDEYTVLIHDEPFFQFVHQLQNLFFAITGKELTLNTNKE